MIDIFQVLDWLNAIDNCSHLNNEARRLIRVARRFSLDDSRVGRILERLRNAAYSSCDPLEKAEILLCCAAVGYWLAWFPQAARDANQAVISYENEDHRRAVALWIQGMAQWEILQNHKAYISWDEARKTFRQRELIFQHLPNERDWYKNRIWQMGVELVERPEEIWTWLNHFERSSLRPPTQQVVKCVQKKIRQQAYSNIYALMQDLQEANRQSEEAYERAEIHLEFGQAVYQMGNTHVAIELLRKAVLNFYPGFGSYHKQVVARCMLGAVEWMQESSYKQAVTDWTRCIDEFEKLRWWADRDNCQEKEEWYAQHRDILRAALLERVKPPTQSDPGNDLPEENGPEPPPSTPNEKETDPYQDLLIKVRWDRAIADRLIELERKKAPTADRNELIQRAIARWLRDNQ